MNQIRPISETAESVTLNRTDFEAMQEELEDAVDRIAVLEDCIIDMKPDLNKYLLTMDETMRIIDGEHPIKVWREKRGMTVRQLADSLGLHDIEIEELEKGRAVDRSTLLRIANRLDVLPDMLLPPDVGLSASGPLPSGFSERDQPVIWPLAFLQLVGEARAWAGARSTGSRPWLRRAGGSPPRRTSARGCPTRSTPWCVHPC